VSATDAAGAFSSTETQIMQRLSTVLLLAALAVGLHSGCRRADDPAAAIASKGSVVIDRGLLNDPTAYVPANYPGASSGSGGGGEAGSGTEDPAIRSMVTATVGSALIFNVSGVFDALDPAQIEPLLKPLPPDDKSVKDALIESVEKCEAFIRLAQEKTAKTDEYERLKPLLLEFANKLAAAVGDAAKIEMLSPDAASVSVDTEKLTSGVVSVLNQSKELIETVLTSAAQEAGAQGTPNPLEGQSADSLIALVESNAGQLQAVPPGVGLPLRKVDGAWKIDIPVPITDEHAGIASEALALGKQFMDKVMEKLQGEASVDQAGMQMMFMEVVGEMMPQFTELQAKIEALAGGQPPEPAPDAPPPDVTGDVVPDDNPRMPRDGRRRP
jgi:hypothetical protein